MLKAIVADQYLRLGVCGHQGLAASRTVCTDENRHLAAAPNQQRLIAHIFICAALIHGGDLCGAAPKPPRHHPHLEAL